MESKRSRKCNMVSIDSDKLKSEIIKRGINLTEASLEIEQNKNYLSSACRSGRISGSAILALNYKYGIKKEDILKAGTKPSLLVKSEVGGIIDVNNNELFHIIYRATLKAMKEALNG